MKTLIIALSIALPAIAHAETPPPPGETPKMTCCCKDKPMACCKEHGRGETGKPDKDEHKGHGGQAH